jgi:transcriptional regulator of acetoin/glycerol metabolism
MSQRWMTIDELNRNHVERVLESCNGDLSQTAKVLAIPRSQLYRWIKQWRIDPKIFKKEEL